MVYWNDNVYVFGGIFVAADECPLWTYHVPVKLFDSTRELFDLSQRPTNDILLSFRPTNGVDGNRKRTAPRFRGKPTQLLSTTGICLFMEAIKT